MSGERTPMADGFFMPPEWYEHQSCFMAWPSRTNFWGPLLGQAKADYTFVARAIADFEPVVMICRPEDAAEVRRYCGGAVQVLSIDIDDSWTRDSGPIFVINGQGEVAVVDFGFNSWGEKYKPYDKDADLTRRLAEELGVRRYTAPFVLEGGAFFVDGEGTMLTTEGPLLDPRRNPGVTKLDVERVAREYLGVESIVWLVAWPDRDTDGHVDGIAQYIGPGRIILLVPEDHGHNNYGPSRENLVRLRSGCDARGREFEVVSFGVTGSGMAGDELVDVPYLNCYLANGAVIVPLAGSPSDVRSLDALRAAFPGREVVGVPGTTLSFGGGGPHCITQQMPVGRLCPP